MLRSRAARASVLLLSLVLLVATIVVCGTTVVMADGLEPRAYDQQRLSDQPEETQAQFVAVWGARGAARWVQEHNAEAAACYEADALSQAHLYDDALKAYVELLKPPAGSSEDPPYMSPSMEVRNRCAKAGIDTTINKKFAETTLLAVYGEAAKRVETLLDEKLAKLTELPSAADATQLVGRFLDAATAFAGVRAQAATDPAGARVRIGFLVQQYPDVPVPEDLTYLLPDDPPAAATQPSMPIQLPTNLVGLTALLVALSIIVAALWRLMVFVGLVHGTYRLMVHEFSPAEVGSSRPTNLKIEFESNYIEIDRRVDKKKPPNVGAVTPIANPAANLIEPGASRPERDRTYATLVAAEGKSADGIWSRLTSWAHPPLLCVVGQLNDDDGRPAHLITLKLTNIRSNQVIGITTVTGDLPGSLWAAADWTREQIGKYWDARHAPYLRTPT